MNIVDIINKKENKKKLKYEEIKYAIDNYLNSNIQDYQMSSLLMAIVLNGMDINETYYLTKAMVESGEIIDLSMIDDIVVDKHSTGGVGDKTTLVVCPLVSSLGIKIAKMSGRGLGTTGGTIDKLESIKGFKTNLTNEKFIKQVNDIGISIVSQTGNLVPADKKIYALRDVTGTTNSIPLIASSIMSKKIASGANKIVLDVKVGKGAFMKTIKDAKELSKTMIQIGKKFNKEVIAVITNMDYPLGNSIGNVLEVREAIDTLKGMGDENFTKLCITLSSYMVSIGKNIPIEEAVDQVVENLNNKKGLEKFYEFVEYQGGKIDDIQIEDNYYEILSDTTGYITDIDTLKLANIVNELGAGRKEKNDTINHKVGIQLNKKINEKVQKNDVIARVYTKDNIDIDDVKNCFTIEKNIKNDYKIILDIIK